MGLRYLLITMGTECICMSLSLIKRWKRLHSICMLYVAGDRVLEAVGHYFSVAEWAARYLELQRTVSIDFLISFG